MTSIWKFEVSVADKQRILMPDGAKILCVDKQEGDIYIWALVDTKAKAVERTFGVHGTGRMIHGNPGFYIGTVQQAEY